MNHFIMTIVNRLVRWVEDYPSIIRTIMETELSNRKKLILREPLIKSYQERIEIDLKLEQ
jgi:hypothetical protein